MVRGRRWVVGLVMLGLVFAQIAAAAHACTVTFSPSPAPATLAPEPGETMASDCAAMAKHVATNANVCGTHCAYGQQVGVQPDSPVAAIAPQPALSVGPVPPVRRTLLETISLRSRSTAPPATLLFSRFLI